MSPRSSQPARLLCCQYTCGPSLELHLQQHESTATPTYTTAACRLESAIERHLLPDNAQEPAVHIRLRNDPHLLDCRRPCVAVQSSILGIYEDCLSNQIKKMMQDNENDDMDDCCDPKVRVSVYQAAVTTSASVRKFHCCCQAPHSEWKRRALTDESTTSQSNDDDDPVSVRIMDLRSVAADALCVETPSAACHLLRSMLGTSHHLSPWGPLSNDDDDASAFLPSVVVLVLPSQVSPNTSTLTTKVRIGDICPSYFLHCTARVCLPTSAPWWLDGSDCCIHDEGSSPMADATLVVYRTIPPRDSLHVQHPLVGIDDAATKDLPVPSDGCLWETYRTRAESSEEPNEHDTKESNPVLKDDKGGEEERQQQYVYDYRLAAPPYISCQQDYPGLLEPLLRHVATIRDEALSIPRWTAWPERQHYSSASPDDEPGQVEENPNSPYPASWTVFPLCHCFPANCINNRAWIRATTSFVPKTTSLLQDLLGDTLRTALFSRLDSETTLEAHSGWQDLANHVYRVHIPLVVPDGGLCGTWVDGCIETHEVGRPLCFDDSKVHRAFNYSNSERVVLILDLARPTNLPIGTATGGHTEELDQFIAQLT